MNIFLLIKWSHFPLKQTLWRKVCKKSVNCGKIEITQEADFLWEEEKENQWVKEKRTSSECCSRSMVSDITDRLLPQIEDWQKRPLDEVYPIVFIDAVHLSVRENGQIKSLQRMLFLLSVLQDISRYCPYISVKTRVQSTGLAFWTS